MLRERRLICGTGAVIALVSGLVACNSILGVYDVTLEKDAGIDAKIPFPPPSDDDDFTPPPDPPTDGGPVNRPNRLQVVLGDQHTCARKPEGTVRCWGDDLQGQVGAGGMEADAGIVATPQPIESITDAIDIAAGRSHACIVHQPGTVSCWGYNLDGQLGNGESNNSHDGPVDVTGLTAAVSVAAGGNFSCAVRGGGTVACWGGNGNGQLGTGTYDGSLAPTLVANLTGVVSMAAGEAHACAVKNDGSVYCWGDGANGQLGSGSAAASPTAVKVANLPEASMVTAGQRSTCALTREGGVYCWGANEVGQLGNGTPSSTPNPQPIAVQNLTDALSVAAGENHVCATRKSGAVVCWGDDARGELGDGVLPDAGTPQFRPSFVTVANVKAAIAVGAGALHSCAGTSAGAIFCWGANDRGQLGNSSGTGGTTEPTPVSVTGYP